MSALSFTNVSLEKKSSTPIESQEKWLSEDAIIGNLEMNWGNTYRLPFLCTTETKVRVFQFMFLHRRVTTNDFLHKIRPKEVDLTDSDNWVYFSLCLFILHSYVIG